MRRNIVRLGGGVALGPLLAFGLAGEAHAQVSFCSSQLKLVNEYLGPLVKPPSGTTGMKNQGVGAMVVTFKLGEEPCFFSAGEIIVGSGVPPDENTVFELASVTKVFTTTILALREQLPTGLYVTDPVKPHLPPDYALMPEEEGVTFQQLATFTGGFHWSDPPGFDWTVPYSQHEFVKHVNHLIPDDPITGELFLPTYEHYSNGSIGFLGQILMHMDSSKRRRYPFDATGFSDWIFDNLTGPLNMTATAVEPFCCDWAQGYKDKKEGGGSYSYVALDAFPWVPWGAAGGLRSNASDMLKFLKANICAYHALDRPCADLPPTILAAMAVAHTPNFYTPGGTLTDPTIHSGNAEQGFAWRYLPAPYPNPDGHTPIIVKDGGHPGFSTYIGFKPDKKYGLVILMNTGNIPVKGAGLKILKNSP